MKKISVIAVLLLILTSMTFAQYKDIPFETKQKIKNNNKILGFINPKNFSFTHSVNMSFQTFGGNSMSLASYTGTLAYKILDNMNLSADVTMQYSPYASLVSGSTITNRDFQNSLSGIYLSRVSLDYKPAKNIFINFEYRNLKNNNYYWDNRFDPYYFGY